MAIAPRKLSLALVFWLKIVGAGTEVRRIPGWLSQPPPRPRYQPSPAMAGVLRAAAATVAKASLRSFIFLPSLKTAGWPRQSRHIHYTAYNVGSPICLQAKCCYAADKCSLSKVLFGACDSLATVGIEKCSSRTLVFS